MKNPNTEGDEGIRRMFEPRLIDPKLDSEGVLTFSTPVVMITAYEALVSSGELGAFKSVVKEVNLNSVHDNILELAFPGKIVKDPVVMIRIWQLGAVRWGSWNDVDATEYLSKHQQPITKKQLAFRPAVFIPRNGEHRVNGSENLSWWQSTRLGIRAWLKDVMIKWGFKTIHDYPKQETIPNERHDNMKTMSNNTVKISGKKVTFEPYLGAIGFSLAINQKGGSNAASVYYTSMIAKDARNQIEDWTANVKFNQGHPNVNASYEIVAHAIMTEGDANKPPVEIGRFDITAERLGKIFGVALVHEPLPAASPDAPKPADTNAAPVADVAKAAPAPAKAPVAAKPLGREQLEKISWLMRWIKSLLFEVSQAKQSGHIKEAFLKDVSAALNKIDPEVLTLEIFADNVKVTEVKEKAKELQEKLLELGKIWREKEAERAQLRNARIAPAAEAPTSTAAPTQTRQPASSEPAKAPVAPRQERVQERPSPTKVNLPEGMVDLDEEKAKKKEEKAKKKDDERPQAPVTPTTPTKNWWYRWGRKLAVALTIIGVLVGLITNDKLMRWLGWGTQDVVAGGDGFKRTPANDSDAQPAGPSGAYASIDAGSTNSVVAVTKHSSDGRINVAVAVGHISGSNNIPITINAGGGEQTQEVKKPKWYELEPSARVDLTPQFHGEQLTYVIPVGENWLFRVPEGWTSVTVKSAYVSQLDYEVASTDNKLPYGTQASGDHIRYLNKMHSEMTITFQCFQVSRAQQQHGKPGLVPRLFHKIF